MQSRLAVVVPYAEVLFAFRKAMTFGFAVGTKLMVALSGNMTEFVAAKTFNLAHVPGLRLTPGYISNIDRSSLRSSLSKCRLSHQALFLSKEFAQT